MAPTLQALAENKLLSVYLCSKEQLYWKTFCIPEQDGKEKCQVAKFHEKYTGEREQLWAWGKDSMPFLRAVDQLSLEVFPYLHSEEPTSKGSKIIQLRRRNCIKIIIKLSFMEIWQTVTTRRKNLVSYIRHMMF